MGIAVKLDDLLHDRRMTLTELAERIDITLANLSILKTSPAKRKKRRRAPSRGGARRDDLNLGLMALLALGLLLSLRPLRREPS